MFVEKVGLCFFLQEGLSVMGDRKHVVFPSSVTCLEVKIPRACVAITKVLCSRLLPHHGAFQGCQT